MPGSFTAKQLAFQFDLATGQFTAGAGGNSASVTGVWAHVDVDVNGGNSSGQMDAAIYGLPLSTMNQLTTLGTQTLERGNNKISVQAGDEETGMSLVFKGTIFDCFPDGSNQPNVPLRVRATSDGYSMVKPAASTTKSGPADVAGLMSNLASQMGLSFENNGVTATLANPYFWGAARVQAAKIAEAAGIYHLVDRGTLSIFPRDGSGQGHAMVSAATGMVGYPKFNSFKIVVDKLFDPSIQWMDVMTVQSDFTAACGDWTIIHIHYALDTQPHGPWFQTMEGVRKQ